MKILCLTGGIASGKSTAVSHLEAKGARVIDADKLGHRAYDPGTDAFAEVVATFGEEVLTEDGQIDRRALGGKVFGKPDELKKLTDIVWPEIRRLAEQEIADEARQNPEGVVVLEAAVLLEAGWNNVGQEVWVITVKPETAIARTIARDGLTREAVEKRLAAQLSNEERDSKADMVIDNNGGLDSLLQQLDAAWEGFIGGC